MKIEPVFPWHWATGRGEFGSICISGFCGQERGCLPPQVTRQHLEGHPDAAAAGDVCGAKAGLAPSSLPASRGEAVCRDETQRRHRAAGKHAELRCEGRPWGARGRGRPGETPLWPGGEADPGRPPGGLRGGADPGRPPGGPRGVRRREGRDRQREARAFPQLTAKRAPTGRAGPPWLADLEAPSLWRPPLSSVARTLPTCSAAAWIPLFALQGHPGPKHPCLSAEQSPPVDSGRGPRP